MFVRHVWRGDVREGEEGGQEGGGNEEVGYLHVWSGGGGRWRGRRGGSTGRRAAMGRGISRMEYLGGHTFPSNARSPS